MTRHGRCLRGRGRSHRSEGISERFRRRDRGMQGLRRRVGFRDRLQRRRVPRSEGSGEGSPGLHAGQPRHRARGPLRRQRHLPCGGGFPEGRVRKGVHIIQRRQHLRKVPELRTLGFSQGADPPALDIRPSASGAERTSGEGARAHTSRLFLIVPRGSGMRRGRDARHPSRADGLVGPDGAQAQGSRPIVSPFRGTWRR